MSAYLVATYDITDPEGYEPYVPGVVPTLMGAGAEILVADYESDPIEGTPSKVTIVIRFESKDVARAWYDSDAYQAVIGHRTNNTEGHMVLTDEFVMPG